jgi:hypothetical protein
VLDGGEILSIQLSSTKASEISIPTSPCCLPVFNIKYPQWFTGSCAEVSVIGDIGGRTMDETVRRCMQYLMTNNLALHFNVYGRHGKRPFGKLKLFNVLNRAVKKNPLLKTSLKDVELAVSKWFTGARDRGGKRVERSKAEKQKRDAAAAADNGLI